MDVCGAGHIPPGLVGAAAEIDFPSLGKESSLNTWIITTKKRGDEVQGSLSNGVVSITLGVRDTKIIERREGD